MGRRNIDPRKQFSKWLARSSAWFLIFYLTALLVLIYFRPEAAISCIYLALIVAVIRVSDAGFYTKNSLTEKMLLTMLDKAKLNFSLNGMTKNVVELKKNNVNSNTLFNEASDENSNDYSNEYSNDCSDENSDDEFDEDPDDETIKGGEG